MNDKLPKWVGRLEIEKQEAEFLAPYAAKAGQSKGRAYPQEEHPLRTAFQRDRDRIIHSAAFRRLEYKTQVFIPHETDHYRTRLTHTIEVAQIARTIARSLRLNEDLTEAVALVHDLGHTPFGHSGEDVLDDLLKDCGGFNHNRQSLRVVELLEDRYPDHPGLNLTFEVREGIAGHETSVTIERADLEAGNFPTMEAALVDIADEIAYCSHDIDDGISSGIINFESLSDSSLLSKLMRKAENESADGSYSRYLLVRALINYLATDIIEESSVRVNQMNIRSLDDVRQAEEKVCRFSTTVAREMNSLKDFMLSNLYRHPRLATMSDWAREIIETLFKRIRSDHNLMPLRFQQMLESEAEQVVIADYIAGMTDRFAVKMYEELE